MNNTKNNQSLPEVKRKIRGFSNEADEVIGFISAIAHSELTENQKRAPNRRVTETARRDFTQIQGIRGRRKRNHREKTIEQVRSEKCVSLKNTLLSYQSLLKF